MFAQLSTTGPLSAAQIVGHAFRFYARHFGTFLLTAAVFWGPVFLFNIDLGGIQSWMSGGGACLLLPFLLVAAFWAWIIGPLTVVNEVACIQQGASPSLRKSIAEGLRRKWSFLGATLLEVLALLCIMLPVALALRLAASSAGLLLLLLLMLLAVVMAVYLMLRWTVMLPSVAIEGRGAAETLGRSWDLTRGHVWHCVGFGVLIYLPILAVNLVLALAGYLAALGLLLAGVTDSAWFGLVNLPIGIAAALLNYLWQPAYVIGALFLYADLLVRKQGPAAETLVAQLPGAQAMAVAEFPVMPPVSQGNGKPALEQAPIESGVLVAATAPGGEVMPTSGELVQEDHDGQPEVPSELATDLMP